MKKVNIADLQYKPILTITEAAALTGIGQNKIENMLKEPDCPYVLQNGCKKMVKKDIFLDFLLNASQI
ncbi:MAG: hypothetical protein E7284_06255 [Lachnospiraceae bacterium]|nr:hypothetical protein [Lachnospiraceae bacterium]